MYQELAGPAKVHLLQSIVSRTLVQLVFDVYFVGLSASQSTRCLEMETFLASCGEPEPFSTLPKAYADARGCRRKPAPISFFFFNIHRPDMLIVYTRVRQTGSAESVNQWRSLTLTILRREGLAKLQGETDARTEAVIAKVSGILDSITDSRASEARDQALRLLVNSAVDLARLLAVQRAVFRVSMPEILPHQKTMFDAATMDDIGGEDEENLAHREICCVTFPGIVKTGDENGGHLQYRNVISRARVLCSPE